MKKPNVKEMFKNKSAKFYGGVAIGVATGIVTLTLGFTISNYVNRDKIEMAEKEKVRQETIQAEVQQELYQKTMTNQVEKSERVVAALSSEIEFIVLTETGSTSFIHKREETNWFNHAEIELLVEYQALFAMPSKNITMIVSNDGTIFVEYNLDYLDVKSVDLTHSIVKTGKGWFGEGYQPREVAGLVAIARDDIYNSLNANAEYKALAEQNLEQFIRDFAGSMGVYNLYFKPTQK